MYETLQDAGYTRESLRKSCGPGREGLVGVFAGVMYEEYQLYGAQAQILGYGVALGGSPASIANRVSYFCDFRGPSMTVDTMCSSSLSAIHLACESLRNGACNAAIAGGVNVTVHPNKYLLLAQGRFLASDGRCASFGEGGDGYVPGEGVGAVLLKPLDQALAHEDQIYGVIKGSAINHGGKTNGYSVPNPTAQADLIEQALKSSGVAARTISYIEAHGTGTALGDPIEIAGLSKAFQSDTTDKQFCAIGSVKSNIGHCESAAGIAALTKVLLQMRHRQLVPSLHSEVLNPRIDFEASPFVVQRELAEWRRPQVATDGGTREHPRRAGISSFGAGGSNAHLIVEEYSPAANEQSHGEIAGSRRAIILLSEKTQEGLRLQAEQLLAVLPTFKDADLPDIAYTLQVGREPMEYRLALLVASLDELQRKLRASIEASDDVEDCYRGELKRNKEALAAFAGDEDLRQAIDSWVHKGKYHKLVDLWAKGLAFDWTRLYGERKPRRICLPTYPFAKERYWIDLRPTTATTACFLQKQWVAADVVAGGSVGARSLIVANEETRDLADALVRRLGQQANITSQQELAACKDPRRWDMFDTWIDLTGCSEREEADSPEWLVGLQAWIDARARQGGMALCMTRGLERFENDRVNLSGAWRAGLFRMLQSEYSRIRSRHVDLPLDIPQSELIDRMVGEVSSNTEDVEVCWRNGRRYRARLEASAELSQAKEAHTGVSPEGVVLITGGTRGLGYLCARHLVSVHGVKRLVLTGREALPGRDEWAMYEQQESGIARKIRAIRALEALGARVHVSAVDLCDVRAVAEELGHVTRTFGPITGVIHSAGLMNQIPAFVRKPLAEIRAVLRPKVQGLDTLLKGLAGQPLKFCVLFSSVSAIVPSLAVGQSDYAMANAYMDYVAEANAQRGMPIVSLQWGSWKDTGLGETRSRAYLQSGLLSHSDVEGLRLLDRILSAGIHGAIAPVCIDSQRCEPQALMQRSSPRQGAPRTPAEVSGTEILPGIDATLSWLKDLAARHLKLAAGQLDPDAPLSDYGADSVILAQMLQPISARVREPLDPSILYEHPTLAAFCRWLTGKYGAVLAVADACVLSSAATSAGASIDGEAPAATGIPAADHVSLEPLAVAAPLTLAEPIAVVGLACRFAGANSPEEYWQLLARGESAIRRVPPERWETSSDHFAGLLDDVTRFDPAFFHLSEADARAMDPQALLVLEESLKAWCDAGYTTADIRGARVGVYLGARSQHRPDDSSLVAAPNPILLGQNYLAANVSRFFDLRGPSLVVDTACSSALVAMSMAIQSLRNREIGAALVGGANVLQSDAALRMFEHRGILQRDGQFHIFDQRARGAILGEGVGMVVLKRLDDARAAGDRIYAVIKSVAINNDGRTAGITAPSIESLKEVMQSALERSGRHADDITYVAVNGSGSEVTDLLELKAIEAVYRTGSRAPCELGSMKPNIGHPLCAEGIASFIKVVMMLHHRQRVPFLSAQQSLKHYDFESSPLRFCRSLSTWGSAPDGAGPVAAINSFADGGTNASLIVESCPQAIALGRRQPLAPPELQKIDLTQRPPARSAVRTLDPATRNVFWKRSAASPGTLRGR